MTIIEELELYASEHEITVNDFLLPICTALSIEDINGYHIAIDCKQFKNSNELVAALLHELGHCMTGGLYGLATDEQIKRKYEHIASVWAIQFYLPIDKLIGAAQHGQKESWELAETFNVSKEFVDEAFHYYVDVRGYDLNCVQMNTNILEGDTYANL